MASIQHLRDNVDFIEINDKKIYLIGTAHISNSSAELVDQTIREVKPDCVAVELCDSRYQSLQDPDRWKNTDILSVLKQGKGYVLLAQLVLAGFQKKLGGKLKIKPGAEMLQAIKVAKEFNSSISLIDRDVKTTLKRTWASLNFWSMCKILYSMMGGLLGATVIEEKDIENLKSADALEDLMRDFSAAFPDVRRTLIEERDQYLAMKLKHSPGTTIVGVVGAGHVPGMLKWIDQEIPVAPLEVIPRPKLRKKILTWLFPVLVLSMIIYVFFNVGSAKSADLVSIWLLVNGGFAALGAILALGHPLSILSAFISAPFTAFHPGWVAGVVEAIIRKPRVTDLESIADDIVTVKGWWQNRVSRILLIMALTNFFSIIGGVVGTYMIAARL